jgi:large subunit ribosomal protein L25
MAEAVTIPVQTRDPAKNKGTGSRVSRRLRKAGRIPGILYGHKQDNVPLSLARDDVWALIKKGAHVARLDMGGTTEMALIRAVQWDHLGREIIHLDFFRVTAGERVTTTVPIVLHGTPVGLSEGGVLEQPVRTVAISCDAATMPDSIRVEVADLRLDQMIHVRELRLPEGVTAVDDPETVVVHIVQKRAEEAAPGTAEGDTNQPELIRKEKKDEDEA